MGLFDGGILGGILGGPGGAQTGAALGATGWGRPTQQPYNPGNYKDKTGVYAGVPDLPQYQQTAQDVNQQGINKYRQEALRSGPSAWAGLQGQQQEQQYGQAMDEARGQVASQTAGAEGSLAMRGGLSSGARERVQKQGLLSGMQAGQNLARTRAGNLLQIGVNDEQNRISQLGSLPGMENQAVSQGMTREAARNQLAQSNAQTEGMIWAAGQGANAQDPRNPASVNYDDQKRWYKPWTLF